MATVFTWDPSDTAGVQSGSGIWDTSGDNTVWTTDGGDSNVAWVDGVVNSGASSAIFAGDDAGGVITVTGNRTIAVDGNYLSFLNSGYTLQSDGSTERIIEFRNNNAGFLISAGKSVTIGNNVTVYKVAIGGTSGLASGTVIIESGGKIGSNGTVSLLGNGTTVQVKAGGSIAASGTVIVGNTDSDHVTLIVDGGEVNVNASSQGNLALINSKNASNASSVATLNSGSITLAGSSSRVLMGEANKATVSSTFNLNGGTITTSGVTDTTAGVSTFRFNGGTLKAGAAANGLIDAASGNFVDALDFAIVQAGGAKIDSNGSDIKVAAALTHDAALGAAVDGGFEKLGEGTVILTGVNTYTGTTNVTAGTLATDGTGTFGAGNLLVAGGASVTFGHAESLDDLASLTFSSTSVINLNFSGIETVGEVILSGGSSIGAGTYTASQLNDSFGFGAGSEVFFGPGSLNVATVIPEPTTWASWVGVVSLMWVAGMRRRNQDRTRD